MFVIDKGFIIRTLKIFLFSLIIMILTIVITYSIDMNVKAMIKGIANIISVFPHTTLEILGFCIFASVLFQLNKSIRSKIRELFNKNNSERTSVIKTLFSTIKIYILAVIQVIILAAFCEEYLRELLYSLLTGI